ncbi:hypothetical protein [Paucidesulfovibrio longus]|uniref:hypothetical protein n=1 Tax=Paucidesulfovibrio longus TaxID=889 RepID=UPI0003B5EC89|nr:hypothetical protein [Paucidesulfovibrio longus]
MNAKGFLAPLQSLHQLVRRWALRFSTALAGGALGGLAASGAAYGLCRLILQRQTGVDAAFWPGWEWAGQACAWGAVGGLLLLPPWLRQSATFKGLLLSLIPTAAMLAGLIPQPHTAPASIAEGELVLAVVPGANAAWGLAACWWMKLCGER